MIIGGFSGLLIASIIPKNTKNIILIDIPTEKKEAAKLNQTIKETPGHKEYFLNP